MTRSILSLRQALLPFLVLELGFGALPVCAATGFVLTAVEDLAVQLDVPFGNDPNDLPLETYCLTQAADLLILLDEHLEEREEVEEEGLPTMSE